MLRVSFCDIFYTIAYAIRVQLLSLISSFLYFYANCFDRALIGLLVFLFWAFWRTAATLAQTAKLWHFVSDLEAVGRHISTQRTFAILEAIKYADTMSFQGLSAEFLFFMVSGDET